MKDNIMEVLESKSIDRNEVLERLARMKRELARKERKLERSKRAQRAKAHVKQKLREQALIDGNGQSPTLDITGNNRASTNPVIQNSPMTWETQLNSRNSSCTSVESDIQRETTPTLMRSHSANRPFLSRLEINQISSKSEGPYRNSKSVDSGKTLHFVSGEIKNNEHVKKSALQSDNSRSNDFQTENVDLKNMPEKETSMLQKKITISPDLLEDCPYIPGTKSRPKLSVENIHDNSLHLTPDPVCNKSTGLKLPKILEDSRNDFSNVKLKLEFERENVLTQPKERKPIMNTGKNEDLTTYIKTKHETHLDSFDYSACVSQSSMCLKNKRKSTELSDQECRKTKRSKSEFTTVSSCHSKLVHNHIEFKNELCDQIVGKSKVVESCDFMLKKENEEICLTKRVHLKEYNLDVSSLKKNETSLTVVSDSVSPETSQSIIKPTDPFNFSTAEKNSQISINSITSKSSEDNHSEKKQNRPKRGKKKQKTQKDFVKTEIKSNAMRGETLSHSFLDFTELDVIPFSQFQYSDCLFSSQDILDAVPGKKGRKSHFGMLVQRRSPRLSTGLKNIVGDDMVIEDTSSSVASTCSSVSNNSQVLMPVLDIAKNGNRSQKKTKKGIIISSVFQFIIDEAKRVKEVREFVLPFHIFNKKLQKRLTSYSPFEVLKEDLKNEKNVTIEESVENYQICKEEPESIVHTSKSSHTTVLEQITNLEMKSPTILKALVKVEDAAVIDTKDSTSQRLLNDIEYITRKHDESKALYETPKLDKDSLKTPNHQPFCFETPKRPSSHMSTPKCNNDPFTTPLQQIRRHKLDQSTDISSLSPSLFPSQEAKEESPIPFCSPVSATKASPLGCADLPEEGICVTEDADDVTSVCKEIDTEAPLTPTCEEGEERRLKTVYTFQTGRQEAILSVLCGVLHTSGSLVDFVVTLSQSSLGIWSPQESCWMNELDWILPAGCEVKKAWLLPSEDKVVVLVSGSSVKIQVLVSVFVYDWLSGDSNKFNLPLTVSIARPISDGMCCPLTDRQVAVFYRQSKKTAGQKLTLSKSFMATVDDISLEGVTEELCSVNCIQDLSQALVGLTTNSILYIWNHESGLLLQSVDISICCPSADCLVSVQSDQGFLLLTVSSSKGDNPISQLAVNPMTSSCMQVMSYDRVDFWKGLKSSSVYEDLLIVLDKGHSINVWDMPSGRLISHLPNLRASSLAVDLSKEQIFSGQIDGCVHIFQIS